MSTGWILREMNPADLKNHKVNIEIYGTQSIDSDMLASVKEFGVLEPLRATKDSVILSGHRRRQHAVAAKCKTVPVLVSRNGISDAEQVIEIVESNRQREKDMMMKAREYSKLAEAKAEIARKREHSGRKSDPREKNPEGVPPSESGRAKAEAAAQVGLSRPTAEKAREVVEVIDKATAAGDMKRADELRDKLNKGPVAAAHRAAVPRTVATASKNGKATVIAPAYDKQKIEKDYGALVRLIDDMARVSALNNSPHHREATSYMSKSLDAYRLLAKECDAVQARKK